MYKNKLSKKYNWFFCYYFLFLLAMILIVGLITIFFLNQIALNEHSIKLGDQLFFGFYNLNVGLELNYFYINWIGILFTILVVLTIIGLCFIFYLYKWSKYTFYFKKNHLAFLFGILIFLLTILLILNFINKISINLKNVDLINRGWIQSVKNNDLIKYNFVYDLKLYRFNNDLFYYQTLINYFGVFWIVFLTFALMVIIGLFIKNEYDKHKFIMKGYRY